jgi:hypothetical protein
MIAVQSPIGDPPRYPSSILLHNPDRIFLFFSHLLHLTLTLSLPLSLSPSTISSRVSEIWRTSLLWEQQDKKNNLGLSMHFTVLPMLICGLRCTPIRETDTIFKLLQALSSMMNVSTHPEHCNSQAIAGFLYSMTSLTACQAGTSDYIAAITTKLGQINEELSGQAIGNALYGLQGLNGDVTGVSAILIALAPLITLSSHELNGQHIGNALYGLQGMSIYVTITQI